MQNTTCGIPYAGKHMRDTVCGMLYAGCYMRDTICGIPYEEYHTTTSAIVSRQVYIFQKGP
ncbi:hypothetical protein DWX59_23835 [Enterocloster aldenensis]|nr:hypothetical protein DWX59_23835 [Enterocloster aldenensis]